MTLQNLAGIGKLKPHKATPEEISRLLGSAADAIADSKRKENSPNSRLDPAYKATRKEPPESFMIGPELRLDHVEYEEGKGEMELLAF